MYLPVWSEDGLAAVNPDEAQWIDMYTNFGGVPNMVFCAETDKAYNLAQLDYNKQNGEHYVSSFSPKAALVLLTLFASYRWKCRSLRQKCVLVGNWGNPNSCGECEACSITDRGCCETFGDDEAGIVFASLLRK
jgi:hypothetical protein